MPTEHQNQERVEWVRSRLRDALHLGAPDWMHENLPAAYGELDRLVLYSSPGDAEMHIACTRAKTLLEVWHSYRYGASRVT